MQLNRYPNKDFFYADIFDAAPKSDIASLEHPIFSLTTRPHCEPWEYRQGEKFVRVNPRDGMPSLLDKDILIFAISQLREGMNAGIDTGNTVEFHPHQLFMATNRTSSGRNYEWLQGAFKRLVGTSIETNVLTGDVESWDEFNIVQRVGYHRSSRYGARQSAYIQLSDWMYRAVESAEVLTLSRDYFRIETLLRRRLYEIARKHCGNQRSWCIGMRKLWLKAGSRSQLKHFRYSTQKAIAPIDAMPQYWAQFDADKDQVTFYNKKKGGRVMLNDALKKSR